MIAATVCEFAYIPTTWNNTSHLTRRLAFLVVILALTGGPTVYIAGFDDTSQVSYIIGIVQFFISVTVTVLFGIVSLPLLFLFLRSTLPPVALPAALSIRRNRHLTLAFSLVSHSSL